MGNDNKQAHIQDAVTKRRKLDEMEERVAAIPIIRELRALGIGANTVAREFDISTVAAQRYMDGTRDVPEERRRDMLLLLWKAVQEWRATIASVRRELSKDDSRHARVNGWEQLVNEVEEKLEEYEREWIEGPPFERNHEQKKELRAQELWGLKNDARAMVRAYRQAVKKKRSKKT